MCGLTINKINAKGGNNVNKHLAYMALTNSATDEWPEFDIDKSIVSTNLRKSKTPNNPFIQGARNIKFLVETQGRTMPAPSVWGTGT